MAFRKRQACSNACFGMTAFLLMSCAGTRCRDGGPEREIALKREKMVTEQLVLRGIADEAVLRAMRTVPRHAFVPETFQEEAYADWPLPIGENQTISQPYIVAYMTEALGILPGAKVLEVGTGSGYQAAVIAEMGAEVYSMEILRPLGDQAALVLKELGYKVHTKIGDGFEGWPEAAPFDAIIVTAAPKSLPPPLVSQLEVGGRLVVPLGTVSQSLVVFVKTSTGLKEIKSLPVRFVPMTGRAEEP